LWALSTAKTQLTASTRTYREEEGTTTLCTPVVSFNKHKPPPKQNPNHKTKKETEAQKTLHNFQNERKHITFHTQIFRDEAKRGCFVCSL
jgi:uncharacterized protein YraI